MGWTRFGGPSLRILCRFKSLFASGSGFIVVVQVDASRDCQSVGREPVLSLETHLREKLT